MALPLRCPLRKPFSPTQARIVELVADGWTRVEIAQHLRISRQTVKKHTELASERIPGTLPPVARITMWARGATKAQLMGGGE